MNKTLKIYIYGLFFAFIFFIFLFFTLKDYGISTDEPTHFKRGQAYLHYFLTGESTYSNLHVKNKSFFQDDKQNGEFWNSEIGSKGHPPVNGILASISNFIFYQNLEILGDVESYHIFNILTACLLVFIVFVFTAEYFGFFPAIIATLSLTLYPLFWSEAHFNIKDPPEATFFAAFIYVSFKTLIKFEIKWLSLSYLFFFLALGTKFNIIFAPIIILIHFLTRVFIGHEQIKINKKFFLIAILGIFLVFLLFIAVWPSLWTNFPNNLINVFRFYKDIGTLTNYQPDKFYLLGINTYPFLWIIFTTPPLILILSTLGLFWSIKNYRYKNFLPIIFLTWFIIPILRISVPNSSVYGGDRQILEFLPAMAILAGLGSLQILNVVKLNTTTTKLVILMSYIFPLLILIKLHPNENVYFNAFMGGLTGAKRQEFPSWGNSYGNAYKQGVDWMNDNVEKNAKVTVLQGEIQNIYPPNLRADLKLSKDNWSGVKQEGEYIIELVFNDTAKTFYDKWKYVDNFLIPIYEVRVENISILKIWKNDSSHLK